MKYGLVRTREIFKELHQLGRLVQLSTIYTSDIGFVLIYMVEFVYRSQPSEAIRRILNMNPSRLVRRPIAAEQIQGSHLPERVNISTTCNIFIFIFLFEVTVMNIYDHHF